ncbi:ribosome small subunit-dependent GTPase A [Novosphingobium rosa]|uniref:ribosome small subunit-dependent GTPase A n=1 Tax=Novosphingobium rosa TaxID=76978 RepID=UPI000A03D3F4|nr:ribosome small subunit-dependent GTPase A [Novosphingobium rosa]
MVRPLVSGLDASLIELGWTPFFSSQLSPDDRASLCPVRIMAVHRGKIAVRGLLAGAVSERLIPPYVAQAQGEDSHATVGDWLLIDEASSQIARILRRASLFTRRTPGNQRKLQLIAANVDTLFIVASCDQDFNLARLERYLVMTREAGVTPVVVLTKADRADDPETFVQAARALQTDLQVIAVNGKDLASAGRLAAWCGQGKTVALMGSSGVGKSTLIKTLTGSQRIVTQAVREGDGKGRHTTTVREMHRLDQGGWLMDTPGMRELHLSEAAEGLKEVFDDILLLAHQCRFSNCGHDVEPDCSVRAAIATGKLDMARFMRWRKLTSEDASSAGGRRMVSRTWQKRVQSSDR